MNSSANATTPTNGTSDGVDPMLALLASLTPADIIGGLFVEIFVACILYGLTTLQTFIYFQTYPNDKKMLKWMVGLVWLLESVHTVFCIQFMYSYLIDGFANPLVFLVIEKGVGVTIAMSSSVALIVQGYYTWRVYIMSGRKFIWAIIIGFFVLTRIGFGTACTILIYKYPNWFVIRSLNVVLACVSGALGSAALVDLLVALSLTYFLKRRTDKHYKASQSIVNKILMFTLNTGAITGTASLICVILFSTNKTSLVFLGLVEIETKLYANSLLGSLNARLHIRERSRSHPLYSSSTGSTSANPKSPVVEILRTTATEVEHDFALHMPKHENSYELESMKTKPGELA
ncbi:uncharacterized protein BXZ73DRAFT_105495 [Epithele typhae]|uniref:uncharacterized protein n=1 Tax=Epithele typhae TaxID=378194 RepID=UPI002007DD29|nr:uncharacterized protein BXZ73DRAFT_105495 [Epithele typhae]KAH9917673.1 hypothetical protein BXZ73DRAFT_105495 [Epithele typhae]